MKYTFAVLLMAFAFSDNDCPPNGTTTPYNSNDNNDSMNSQIKIKIGASTFTTTLLNNVTATAFKALLPMTVKMTELNGNEKYFNFSTHLPTEASNPSTIQSGDLMMYGSDTLVLFYKTFSTSYSYTKLGRVDDAAGLAAALGSGNITVTFELL